MDNTNDNTYYSNDNNCTDNNNYPNNNSYTNNTEGLDTGNYSDVPNAGLYTGRVYHYDGTIGQTTMPLYSPDGSYYTLLQASHLGAAPTNLGSAGTQDFTYSSMSPNWDNASAQRDRSTMILEPNTAGFGLQDARPSEPQNVSSGYGGSTDAYASSGPSQANAGFAQTANPGCKAYPPAPSEQTTSATTNTTAAALPADPETLSQGSSSRRPRSRRYPACATCRRKKKRCPHRMQNA